MARRNKPPRPNSAPLSSGSVRGREEQADGTWLVSTRPGGQGDRDYICPICSGRVAPQTAHLVVWPESGTVADRRHVHTACWRRRAGQRDPVRW